MFRLGILNMKKNSGPWNEVTQNLKRVFQSESNDYTSEPQDELVLCFYKKSCTTRPKLANDELVTKFARL